MSIPYYSIYSEESTSYPFYQIESNILSNLVVDPMSLQKAFRLMTSVKEELRKEVHQGMFGEGDTSCRFYDDLEEFMTSFPKADQDNNQLKIKMLQAQLRKLFEEVRRHSTRTHNTMNRVFETHALRRSISLEHDPITKRLVTVQPRTPAPPPTGSISHTSDPNVSRPPEYLGLPDNHSDAPVHSVDNDDEDDPASFMLPLPQTEASQSGESGGEGILARLKALLNVGLKGDEK